MEIYTAPKQPETFVGNSCSQNPKFEVGYLLKFSKIVEKDCHRDSPSNFTKNETSSQLFLKKPAHFPGTPIIPRNTFQCQLLKMFALSKHMCFIVIFTSVLGLFIFTQFKRFLLYVYIRHLRICPSHVLMSFLNTLNVNISKR